MRSSGPLAQSPRFSAHGRAGEETDVRMGVTGGLEHCLTGLAQVNEQQKVKAFDHGQLGFMTNTS